MRRIAFVVAGGLVGVTALTGQRYVVEARVCGSPSKCPFSSVESRSGALRADAADYVQKALGLPFDIEKAEGTKFFGQSSARMDGPRIRLFSRLQAANFPQWMIDAQSNPVKMNIDPVFASVSWSDVVTVPGETGKGYFLPVFRLSGKFTRPPRPFLDPFLAVCLGIGTGCVPKVWYAPPESSTLDTEYQAETIDALSFDFGIPFVFQAGCYVRAVPPRSDRDGVLETTFTGEERIEFSSIEMLGVVITDKAGRDVGSASISSRSGVKYQVLKQTRENPE